MEQSILGMLKNDGYTTFDPDIRAIVHDVAFSTHGSWAKLTYASKEHEKVDGKLQKINAEVLKLMPKIEEAKQNVGNSFAGFDWNAATAGTYLETSLAQSSSSHLHFLEVYVKLVRTVFEQHKEYQKLLVKAKAWEARVFVEFQKEQADKMGKFLKGKQRLSSSFPALPPT